MQVIQNFEKKIKKFFNKNQTKRKTVNQDQAQSRIYDNNQLQIDQNHILQKNDNEHQLVILQNSFMNYVIIEDGPIKILSDQDWQKIINEKNIQDISKKDLYRTLEHGIPFKIRKDIWLLLADIQNLKLQFNQDYENLIQQTNKWDRQIQKDIDRTFPDDYFFQNGSRNIFGQEDISGKERLYKILLAYSNLDPEVGYTQGMNYIVAAILLCLNPDNDKILEEESIQIFDTQYEKNVFWIFVHIMYKKKWRDLMKNSTPKLIDMIQIFESKLKIELPLVHQHLEDLNVFYFIQINYYGCFGQCFITILVYKTPIVFVKRIFDLFLLDGENVVYTILFKILYQLQNKILSLDSCETLYPYLRDEIVKNCFEEYKNKRQNGDKKFPFEILQMDQINTY